MHTYLKNKNNESKKEYKNYKRITTILKSIDTIVFFVAPPSSITLNLTGIGLIAIPIISSTAWGLMTSNKVIYEIFMQKNNKYKKQYEKDQQTLKSSDKVYRKKLKDSVYDKKE